MLEIVTQPVDINKTRPPEQPVDDGVFAVRGLFVRHHDKALVIDALDHARVQAWRDKMRWNARVSMLAKVAAGLEKISNVPGIKKGYNNTAEAQRQAGQQYDTAAWRHAIFRQAELGMHDIRGQRTWIGHYNRFPQLILNGIYQGVRIMNQEAAQKAAKHKKPAPPPVEIAHTEVSYLRFDYTKETVFTIDMSSVAPAPGVPAPEVPQYDPHNPNQPPKSKEGGPAVDLLNPQTDQSKPDVPLLEPEPVTGTMSERAQEAAATYNGPYGHLDPEGRGPDPLLT